MPFDRDVEIDVPDARKIIEDELTNAGLNRKERRHRAALPFTKAGGLTPLAIQMALGAASAFAKNLGEKYPLSLEAREMAIQAAVGKIPAAEFGRQLTNSLARLSEFQRWHELKWEEMAPSLAWLRERGDAQVELLRGLRGRLDEIREKGRSSGLSEVQLHKLNEKSPRTAETKILERVMERVRAEVPNANNGAGTWEQSPGLRSNLSLACHTFNRNCIAGQERKRREGKRFRGHASCYILALCGFVSC